MALYMVQGCPMAAFAPVHMPPCTMHLRGTLALACFMVGLKSPPASPILPSLTLCYPLPPFWPLPRCRSIPSPRAALLFPSSPPFLPLLAIPVELHYPSPSFFSFWHKHDCLHVESLIIHIDNQSFISSSRSISFLTGCMIKIWFFLFCE